MKKQPSKAVLLAASMMIGTVANAAVYTQNFTFANGTSNFGDGTTLTTGAAPSVPATVQNNALLLTSTLNGSTQNTFNIPALANSALGFTMTFNVTLTDTLGGNPPADGFSVNYGNMSAAANYGEEGPGGTSLSWIVDTWDNQLGDQGIRSKINGVNDFVQLFAPLADGQTLATNVALSWNPTNGMSLSIGGAPVFTNRATPGFTGNDAYTFGIGARTGGATEDVIIDNLVITTVPEATTSLLAAFAGLGLLTVRRRK